MKKNGIERRASPAAWPAAMRLIVLLALLPGRTALAQRAAAPADAARTEGAISGGLRWLADHQNRVGAEAGSWPVNTVNYRPAIASLAGLAYLANGHLPGESGPYSNTVAQALRYVMGAMAPDGYIGQGDRSGMYIHAIASLFAFSCLGMQADETLEPKLAEWCRRSLDVLLRAQQIPKAAVDRGGWRYDPYTTESDVSVTCWQLLVLHTARQAGFEVEPSVFHAAQAYLHRAYVTMKADAGREKEGLLGGYVYYPPIDRKPSHSSTALAVFVLSLFDAAEERHTRQALAYLRRYTPTWGGPQYGGFFYFSSFYMVQGMFQLGGEEWEAFGPRMATLLLDHQAGDGSWPYPPDNASPATMRGTGPAYPVAMAVLMLSLDKQYLPMYQRQRRLYDRNVVAVAPVEKAADPEKERDPEKKPPAPPDPELALPPVPVDAGKPVDSGDGGAGDGEEEEEEERIDRTIGRRMDGN